MVVRLQLSGCWHKGLSFGEDQKSMPYGGMFGTVLKAVFELFATVHSRRGVGRFPQGVVLFRGFQIVYRLIFGCNRRLRVR